MCLIGSVRYRSQRVPVVRCHPVDRGRGRHRSVVTEAEENLLGGRTHTEIRNQRKVGHIEKPGALCLHSFYFLNAFVYMKLNKVEERRKQFRSAQLLLDEGQRHSSVRQMGPFGLSHLAY